MFIDRLVRIIHFGYRPDVDKQTNSTYKQQQQQNDNENEANTHENNEKWKSRMVRSK